jgi:hypothetical protein
MTGVLLLNIDPKRRRIVTISPSWSRGRGSVSGKPGQIGELGKGRPVGRTSSGSESKRKSKMRSKIWKKIKSIG